MTAQAQTPTLIDLWCEDCEDLWEVRAWGQADHEVCPHCGGRSVSDGSTPQHNDPDLTGLGRGLGSH